jgi:methylenetetrahydrofolate--tRNA-(uracil-5-)-methyltransferase
MVPKVRIIGAGLAGVEAAWQAARFGIEVELWEMRPAVSTPAHRTDLFAELICSNSLRAQSMENAVGLLKEELRRLGSLIMECADRTAIPAGGALAVDRHGFSAMVTEKIKAHPQIHVIRKEVREIPLTDGAVVIATGPLTSPAMAESIRQLTSSDALYFYDAAAPIVMEESLDASKIFRASRYGKGLDDYINCPMDEEQYLTFWKALISARLHPIKDFENERYFEGCMPVENLAKRGEKTLLFGPLKPVGLVDPRNGARPYAVVQLRQDDAAGKMFNMVGFQTRLAWLEQERVFRMIPGMEHAEFARYGFMHRNMFIEARRVLLPTMQTKVNPRILFGGQITGVEGYVESTSNGLVAGINAARVVLGLVPVEFPHETAHGALCRYITTSVATDFQPMNINFGLLPSLDIRIKDKRARGLAISEHALAVLDGWKETIFKR